MKTVTLSVASREDVTRRARAAFKGKMQGAHISFASVKLLWQTLKKTVGAAESDDRARSMTIREIARRVGRDVKAYMVMCMRSSER
jgi:predicted transcriptional regulator